MLYVSFLSFVYTSMINNSNMNKDKTVIISGGGLVGFISAIGLVNKGFKVKLFESRFGNWLLIYVHFILYSCIYIHIIDPRSPKQLQKLSRRSINLAISSRALTTIKCIDNDDGEMFNRLITNTTIPMKGRMIHKLNGDLDSQIYSSKGEVC